MGVGKTAALVSYQQYLNTYPQGRYAAAAEQGKIMRAEEETWQAALAKNTLSNLQDYLQAYPQGRFTAQANKRVAALQQAELTQQDEKDWLDAQASNSTQSYNNYLRKHSQGRYAADARQSLQQQQQYDMQKLGAVCKGKAVPHATAYKKGPGIHPIACLAADGSAHEWSTLLPTEWHSTCLEETELVVIIYPQRMTFLSIHHFRDHYGRPAPSVSRYRFDVTVRVVAARTGKSIAQQTFCSIPRSVHSTEPYDLTTLAVPVDYHGAGIHRWLQQIISPLR